MRFFRRYMYMCTCMHMYIKQVTCTYVVIVNLGFLRTSSLHFLPTFFAENSLWCHPNAGRAMPSDPHGVAEEIEEHLEVEEPLLAKRFEMACSAKELEEDFALDTEEEDVLSQRTTELASSFGSSDDLRLALARGQAEAEESTAPSSAAELHRVGFGHLACFANEFARTMPVRSLADVPAPALLSRTLPLPPINRRRPGDIQLPAGSRSCSRPSSAGSIIDSRGRDPCRSRDLCSPVRRRAERRPWHRAASPV